MSTNSCLKTVNSGNVRVVASAQNFWDSYQLTDPVQNKVDDFLSNGVVTTCIVVGSIFLASNQLFRVKKLAVGSSTDLICCKWI